MSRPLPFVIAVAAACGLVVLPATHARAQTTEHQIAGAVLPLPEAMRSAATVLGYGTDMKLQTLRRGSNGMICLADDPRDDQFHASCYHEGMEPFMARGRELRASGVTGPQVDTVRFAEVKSGKLKVPSEPASLYQVFAKKDAFDPATGKVTAATSLFVIYMPYATEKSTGLLARPREDGPWLMFPGTPKAHIMFTAKMSP
jgi:hypothetical protein